MKENTAQAKALDSLFIQDISAHEHIQIWFLAGYVGLAVFQPGGFACSPCTEELCSAGGDHPTFPIAASGFTNSFPGTAGHTWKP